MPKNVASVFLNVPFDETYESYFIALVASIASVGRTPRCVLELSEFGSGRLARLVRLLKACSLSIHDLSRVGMPVRFNMPFELGLAVSLGMTKASHRYLILERKRYRLDRTLSDLKGRDPLIYDNSVKRLIASVVGALGPKKSGKVNPATVYSVYEALRRAVPILKKKHASESIFTRAVFVDLVAAATILGEEYGLLTRS